MFAKASASQATSRYLSHVVARSMASSQGESSKIVETRSDKEGKLAHFKGKRFPDFESAYRKRGAGGRASFNGITATVFGSNSLIGRSLIPRLGKTGSQLVITYRGSRYNEEKMRTVGDLGQVYFSHFNLKDEKSLYEAMRYSNVVINLIGKELETKNFSFDEVHVEGPRRMARIAREAGVKKFIHISALNCNPNPTPWCLKNGSQFLKSKYYGELAVREEFPDAVIFRPSDILGEADNFLNHFTAFERVCFGRHLGLWDHYDGVEKQPVWIRDLTEGIENCIYDDSSDGKTYQAVGPYRYNFYDLIEYMRSLACMGEEYGFRNVNLRYHWPMQLYIWASCKMQKYPFMSWERVERDCHSDYVDPNLPTLTDLGVKLTPLEIHIQTLAFHRPREIRVEVPYGEVQHIEAPKKLNLVA